MPHSLPGFNGTQSNELHILGNTCRSYCCNTCMNGIGQIHVSYITGPAKPVVQVGQPPDQYFGVIISAPYRSYYDLYGHNAPNRYYYLCGHINGHISSYMDFGSCEGARLPCPKHREANQVARLPLPKL